jgi:pimeloyl-ACP methyl ester carboxylesterase
VSNIELNLIDCGHGAPAVVFIHGFTCNLSSWKEQLDALSGSHRCVAVDLPGHGDSAESGEATIEVLAQAVNDTLDALELKEVVLVGHSMGCRIVSETFSQSPSRVCGVVYVDGSVVASGDADVAARRAVETIEHIGMERFLEQFYDGFFVESTPAAVRDFVYSGLAVTRMGFAMKLWPNVVRWDASRSHALLETIDVPALVIQSTALDENLKRVSLEQGQTAPWMDAVSKAVKDVTIVVVPGVGHFPMLEAPQQTSDAISNFVRRLTENNG